MYAMTGKLTAQAGKRTRLVEILLEASRIVGQLPECLQYVVAEDIADESVVWVFEVWNDKDSHDASLRNEKVRLLISEAMPLINGAPGGAELKIAGGHGIQYSPHWKEK
jgi:quinol monooxygenase YgiN